MERKTCADNIRVKNSRKVSAATAAGSRKRRQHQSDVYKNVVRRHTGLKGKQSSDQDRSKILPPSQLHLFENVKITDISCGLYHTLLLTDNGRVLAFGSNDFGQLGEFINLHHLSKPSFVNLPNPIKAIAAGGNHSVALTNDGSVFTWGNGFQGNSPVALDDIGTNYRKTGIWIRASGDCTFINVSETLLSSQNLDESIICANQSHIIIFPLHDTPSNVKMFALNRLDGSCCSFSDFDHIKLSQHHLAHIDTQFGVLWTFDTQANVVNCYNPCFKNATFHDEYFPSLSLNILYPELALPTQKESYITRHHAGVSLLSCIHTLTTNAFVSGLVSRRDNTLSKSEYRVVDRFQSYGGGWGYSAHAMEAIRFSSDTDVLVAGLGLFGGRGEYVAKVKIFNLSKNEVVDGDSSETEDEFMVESEEIVYECEPRQKYQILFEEPVLCHAGQWYVAWACISGPSSDCGSAGISQVKAQDGIVFSFKNSKKSNNGTDLNAGQIPQIIYIPLSENLRRKAQPCVHTLSPAYTQNITSDCFKALHLILTWAWSSMISNEFTSSVRSITFICRVGLRLCMNYIHISYPSYFEAAVSTNQTVLESKSTAECVLKLKELVEQMLSNSNLPLHSAGTVSLSLILQDAHHTFVNCFYAFYPTGYLKWVCLCNLLEKESCQFELLLMAVLDALSSPSIRLSQVFPIINLNLIDNEIIMLMDASNDVFARHFPLLTELINFKIRLKPILWNFRHVLDRLLSIAMRAKSDLSKKTCNVIASVVSELAFLVRQRYDLNIQDIQFTDEILHCTPSRFNSNTSDNTWNTGNGSPDAICFSIDRSGILIAGCTIFSSPGINIFEVELLKITDQNWNSLAIVRGTTGSSDLPLANSSNIFITSVKFERPVSLDINVKYALRLRNQGMRTFNGDNGVATVKGPEDTTFTFTTCSLSSNGTNVVRGQIPQILYYSISSEIPEFDLNEQKIESIETRSRYACKTALSVLSKIFDSMMYNIKLSTYDRDKINSASMITCLLPNVLTSISTLIPNEPAMCVKVINLIKDLLHSLSDLLKGSSAGYQPTFKACWVESDHPYRSASVTCRRLCFPSSIRWMSVEFDRRCCTSQFEDFLQLYVRNLIDGRLKSVSSKFRGSVGPPNWPQKSLILSGNEIFFLLSTASDYAKNNVEVDQYGFRCFVVGYEEYSFKKDEADVLRNLEVELSYIGGFCASSLLKSSIKLSSSKFLPSLGMCFETDSFPLLEEHFILERPMLIEEAIDDAIPFRTYGNENQFLSDFVASNADTLGGQLARWLQPESFVYLKNCQIILNPPIYHYCLTHITIVTKDQYSKTVFVPSVSIYARAVFSENKKVPPIKIPSPSCSYNTDFGGHQTPPVFQAVHYAVCIKDKMHYHSISMQRDFDNYSFEEIRFASLAFLQRPAESMIIKSIGDGNYEASWIPGCVGSYLIYVSIDEYDLPVPYEVEVLFSPLTNVTNSWLSALSTNSNHNLSFQGQSLICNRKFVVSFSSGLRIRSQPSLQSPQIGIIPKGANILTVEEIHNSDGVWVRLSSDTFHQHCQEGFQGWSLQYNQQLGKVLLNTVDVTANSLGFTSVQRIMFCDDQKQIRRRRRCHHKVQPNLPVTYIVTRCASSGHNVRCRPNVMAPAIGLLKLGQCFTVADILQIKEETWVQLQFESIEHRYFVIDNIQAWSLSVNEANVHYLDVFIEGENDTDDNVRSISCSNGDPHSFRNLHNQIQTLSPFKICDDRCRKDVPFLLPQHRETNIALSKPVLSEISMNEIQCSVNQITIDKGRTNHNVATSTDLFRIGRKPNLNTKKATISKLTKGINDSKEIIDLTNQHNSFDIDKEQSVELDRPKYLGKPIIFALSPLVAETMRSVFAAFASNEAIVEDLMAVATCLQKYPSMSRRLCATTSSSNGILNICGRLILLWEDIKNFCLYAHQQIMVKSYPSEIDESKQNDIKMSTTLLRTYDESMTELINENFYQRCEMCEQCFPHPITCHMRISHPGCGGHFDYNKGYNSGGHYCSGWDGNCGEGGQDWYIICQTCRENYMKQGKVDFGYHKKLSPSLEVSAKSCNTLDSVGQMNKCRLMHLNAMYLINLTPRLDLADSVTEENTENKKLCLTSGLKNLEALCHDEDVLNIEPVDGANVDAVTSSVAFNSLFSHDGTPLIDEIFQKPIMKFLQQWNNLDCLHASKCLALRKVACKVFGIQTFDWLLRLVSQPNCFHDLLWFFVSCLDENTSRNSDEKEVFNVATCLFDNPVSDVLLAGTSIGVLSDEFHALLMTIFDLMCGRSVPFGSALQQVAITCWSVKFDYFDYDFLQNSGIFTFFDKLLLTHTNDDDASVISSEFVQDYLDITSCFKIKVSSRQSMVGCLIDNSTETFWESDKEDNKVKSIFLSIPVVSDVDQTIGCCMCCVYIDNTRDSSNRVSNVTFKTGNTSTSQIVQHKQGVDARFAGWIIYYYDGNDVDANGDGEKQHSCFKIEICGPNNTLRLRQIKVLRQNLKTERDPSSSQVQETNCRTEALRIFRLLTQLLFHDLIGEPKVMASEDKSLTKLQKYLCCHIVKALNAITLSSRLAWSVTDPPWGNNCYGCEILKLIVRICDTEIGLLFFADQTVFVHDLLILLHTGTFRIQKYAVSLLRKLLPIISPTQFACLQGIPTNSTIENKGIFDVFFGCIARAISLRVKHKKSLKVTDDDIMSNITLSNTTVSILSEKWWYLGGGAFPKDIAKDVIALIRELTHDASSLWAGIVKNVVNDCIRNFTRSLDIAVFLDDKSNNRFNHPYLWFMLASLCVLQLEHTRNNKNAGEIRPTCSNHDDFQTPAVLTCNVCGELCSECDRVLHLHRKTKLHHRLLIEQEVEAVQIDAHEGCGRLKLFCMVALTDPLKLKSVIEFRNRTCLEQLNCAESVICRFCGTSTSAFSVEHNFNTFAVCNAMECIKMADLACLKVLPCGHICNGISDEAVCLPCLQCPSALDYTIKQDADDMCMICFTDSLFPFPSILLDCGHVFHFHCCRQVLLKRWYGPRITFGFRNCPICKQIMRHPSLEALMDPINKLYQEVESKAVMRLEYEGITQCLELRSEGGSFYKDPKGFSIERYAYYVCFKCNKVYFGGLAQCDSEMAVDDNFDSSELVCGGCSDVACAQMCPRHGMDFLEYKCRYCCSVAIFFCFGTTHFCGPCHDDFQRIVNMPKMELPRCPVGPKSKAIEGSKCPLNVKHPNTGEEFALGCGICRNASTF